MPTFLANGAALMLYLFPFLQIVGAEGGDGLLFKAAQQSSPCCLNHRRKMVEDGMLFAWFLMATWFRLGISLLLRRLFFGLDVLGGLGLTSSYLPYG